MSEPDAEHSQCNEQDKARQSNKAQGDEIKEQTHQASFHSFEKTEAWCKFRNMLKA